MCKKVFIIGLAKKQFLSWLVPGTPPPAEYPYNLIWCLNEALRQFLDEQEEETGG